MNIDPNKIKELILLFADLDDDYQTELMKQAYILSLKQSQKNLIMKEGKSLRNNDEFKKEIQDRSNIRAKKSLELLENLKKLDDDKKAEFIILLDKLSGGSITRKTEIEIKINEKKMALKDYLEEILPGTEFKSASKNAKEYLKNIDYKE